MRFQDRGIREPSDYFFKKNNPKKNPSIEGSSTRDDDSGIQIMGKAQSASIVQLAFSEAGCYRTVYSRFLLFRGEAGDRTRWGGSFPSKGDGCRARPISSIVGAEYSAAIQSKGVG